MSSAPSFERFDYLLRTNKHIERKLVFDVLSAAAGRFGFMNHWYLGFGSMWFGDFRLAHRLLGIDELVSIELNEYAPRANFNRPFAGVDVHAGESNEVLTAMPQGKWQNPVVAWLDYDGHLKPDVVKDIDVLLSRSAKNSVVAITVNGVRGTYRVKKQDGRHQRSETSVGVVESFLGAACIDPKYDPQPNEHNVYTDIKESEFPQFLCDSVSAYMEHKVSSLARQVDGQRVKFVPLFSLRHRDGADMVTVGGALAAEEDVDAWKKILRDRPIIGSTEGRPKFCELDLIPMTVKEKIALDACLPDLGDGTDFLAAARASGLTLGDKEIAKYRMFYRHFPVFVESAI